MIILLPILISITILSIQYKIYLRAKIDNPEKRFFPPDIPYPTDFLPLKISNAKSIDLELVKKANIALAVFYISGITCFVLIYIFYYP